MADTVRHEPGLVASPGVWHKLEVGGSEGSVSLRTWPFGINFLHGGACHRVIPLANA